MHPSARSLTARRIEQSNTNHSLHSHSQGDNHMTTSMKNKAIKPTNETQGGMEVVKNCACLGVHFTGLMFRHKIDLSSIIEGKRAKDIHTTINLIDPDAPEFKALKKAEGAFRTWIRTRAVSAQVMPPGVYMVPFDLIEDDLKREDKDREARKKLTEDLIAVYDDLKEIAKEDSKDTASKMAKKYALSTSEEAALRELLCDDRHYPTEDEIRQAFDVVTRYYDYNVPDRLQHVNTKIFQKAQEQFSAECAELYGEVRNALRAAFNGLVSHIVDRLGYEDEGNRAGKKKVFSDSMVEKMEDFLKTFEARNLTNDTDLKAIVEKARKAMKGV